MKLSKELHQKAVNRIRQKFEAELEKVCNDLVDEDSFSDYFQEGAERLRCIVMVGQILGVDLEEPEEVDSLGAPAPEESSLTLEDFVRAVNVGNQKDATNALAHAMGLAPNLASACVEHFMMKWTKDPYCYDKLQQMIGTQNPNQYQWLLYELFGITSISNSRGSSGTS